MRWLLLVLLFSRFAMAYPAGAANEVVRVPSTGGPVETGAVDLTKSAAVTGLTAPFIPYWNGIGAVGIANSNCSFDSGTNTFRCTNLVGPRSQLHTGTVGDVVPVNVQVISARTTAGIACTVSPCSFTQEPLTANYTGISSITRAAAGSYHLNFTASFWSVVPICVANSSSGLTSGLECHANYTNPSAGPSTSVIQVNCYENDGGTSQVDSVFSVTCAGQR